VRGTRVFRAVLGVEDTVVEGVDFDAADGQLTVSVRPAARARARCGVCRARCPGFDQGSGRRRWRSLDFASTMVFLEAAAPRVRCREHGVVVAHVPWARHGAGHTRAFDDQVAWLATQTSRSAATKLMRVAWRTVGAIIARVWADIDAGVDRLAGLRRIGIDEISYKRGHKYLVVVVDHDTGRLVWAAPGRDKATVEQFFDALGPERCTLITHISADGASWIAAATAARCPQAVRCTDPFHVVSWATDELDNVRIRIWKQVYQRAKREERKGRWGHHPAPPRPLTAQAAALRKTRFALWKNPENLTTGQHEKLAWIVANEPELARAYRLKEGLRMIFKVPAHEAAETFDWWVNWAARSRIPEFVSLQRRLRRHRATILAATEHHLSNARVEGVNTKIRLLTRIAFGFRSADALIALAMLHLGGHRPPLPGRP
jgi:transposase